MRFTSPIILALLFVCGCFSATANTITAHDLPQAYSVIDETSPIPAAFAIFQVNNVSTITCNLDTGVASVGGPCVSPTGACNGSTDDAKFTSFQTWALANQGTNKQVILTIPAQTCGIATSNLRPNAGIRNVIWSAYGATITGPGFGIGGHGIPGNNTTSALTATVSSGATSVTLLTMAQNSRFTVGQWAVMTGIDLQGSGQPPNPAFHDFVQITAINTGTGVITFTPALTHDYLSTWPSYNLGSGGEPSGGGPATLYALPADWDTTVEIQGLTINAAGQTNSNGKTIIQRNVTYTANVGNPSQSLNWSMINNTATAAEMEMDKIATNVTITGGTFVKIVFQSSSITNFTMNGGAVVTDTIAGTPVNTTINGATLGNLEVGAQGQGRTKTVSVTNAAIAGTMVANPVTDKGTVGTDAGVNNVYTMVGGLITVPKQRGITAAAASPTRPLIRLTLSTAETAMPTAAWTTGKTTQVSGITGNATEAVGTWVVTVVDGSHLDLQGSTFVSGHTDTTGGQIGTGAVRWAIPGTNMFWSSTYRNERAFTVSTITDDVLNTYIQTSEPSGFPTIPISGGVLFLVVHPAPVFTCSGCTGGAAAVDFAQAPAGIPIYSYSKRTYDGTLAGNDPHAMWGHLTSLSMNVTKRYTGSNSGTQQSDPAEEVTNPGSSTGVFYAPLIDIKALGNRVVTPAGVTGAQGGDSALTLPDPASWFSTNWTTAFTPSISTECATPTPSTCPIMTIEMTTDQGIVP